MRHERNNYVNDIFNPSYNVWIEANAGSGKTSALVNRYLSLLLNGVGHDTIYCITYTNAAANEMKERVLSKLKYWSFCSNEEVLNDLCKILTKPALQDVEFAKSIYSKIVLSMVDFKISTIHSFCQVLLKNYDFKIASTDVLNDIFIRSFDEFFEQFKENEELQHSYSFLISKIGKNSVQDGLTWMLKHYLIYPHLFKKRNLSNPDDFLLEMRSLHDLCDDQDVISFLFTDTMSLRQKIKNHRSETQLLFQKYLKASHDVVFNNMVSCFEVLCPIFIKIKDNYISYDELLVLSLAELSRDDFSDIRLFLDTKIHHILVDESQDVNPISWKIIRKVIDDFLDGASISGGIRSFFVVGDSKQSIFSFQGADIKIYQNEKSSLLNKVKMHNLNFIEHTLDVSYRCGVNSLSLVDKFINSERFDGSFLTKSIHKSGFGTKDEVVIKSFKDTEDMELDVGNDWVKKYHDISDSCSDLSEIAQEIDSIIKSNPDKSIMIIYPARSGNRDILTDIIFDLKSSNPYLSVIDKAHLSKMYVFRDILILLKVISNHLYNDTFSCFLRSPIVGLELEKLEDLLYSYKKNKSISVFETILESEKSLLKSDLIWVCNKIHGWQNELKNMNAKDFVSHLLCSEFVCKKMYDFYGHEYGLICDIVIEKLDELSFEESFSLDYIISVISKISERQDIFQTGNVVLSTIHGSKGLEADIVILLENVVGFGSQKISSDICVINDNLFLPYKDFKYIDEVVLFDDLERQKITQEKARLLYVALTRAKFKLFIFTTDKVMNDEDSYSGILKILYDQEL